MSGTPGTKYLYTGQQFDAPTGLYSLRARYYNTSLGQFLSRDTVNDGLNFYGYVHDNPINRYDPRGNEAAAGYSGNLGNLAGKVTAPLTNLGRLVGARLLTTIVGIVIAAAIDIAIDQTDPQDSWVFVGWHGTDSASAARIVAGAINPYGAANGTLGPGFYTTPNKAEAADYAEAHDLTNADLNSKPTILAVFARGFYTKMIPAYHAPPPNLSATSDKVLNYDYIYGEVMSLFDPYKKITQIKFNPRAILNGRVKAIYDTSP